MADSLKARGVNLALGTWRDITLRDLRDARRLIDSALEAAQDGDAQEAGKTALKAAGAVSSGAAHAFGWQGAAEMARLLADETRDDR